ncbi:SAF domain-containing protein [Microbacterium indicum]|uniref:SAF domain-containing protein n=1 Tax=Microbacterium indicum TaxID=358100 RepID=UPI0004907454|nr:SAF domain-containing protein [Microbacterium indicum]
MASTPRASQRRPWADPRLLLGLVLIGASIAGVWWVVQSARTTEPALAAAGTIVPGQTLTASDVVAVDVQLGSSADGYLNPAALEDGLVATRALAAGELIPVSATGAAADLDVTTLVVQSALEVPVGVQAGSSVELWAAAPVGPGEYDEPALIVPDAVVGQVIEDDGVVSQAGAKLELVVPRDAVAVVLANVSGGSALSAVPVAGGGR